MKTSFVISIALFAVFLIPEISCSEEKCLEFKDICIEDNDCCSKNCFLQVNKPEKYCIEPKNTEYDHIKTNIEHVMCSYNKSFHDSSNKLLFEFYGLSVANTLLPASTKLQLTLNNKTIDVLVNSEQPKNNSSFLELSKETAEALNITKEGLIPCSIYLYEHEPDYSAIKTVLGVSVIFFVFASLATTFL